MSATTTERERSFFDEQAQQRTFLVLRRAIWRMIGEFNRNHELHSLYDPAGKDVLLYGCGPANGAERFLERGARSVSGFDISEAEIEKGRREGLDLRVADAHHLAYGDASFDLIVGSAILHHLDLPVALREIQRILRPGGRAVFLEPLAHNPILRLGRALTPSARTADEHPLRVSDWKLCSELFPGFRHFEAECLTIPLMPLNLLVPRSWQKPLARRLTELDKRALARAPRLRPYARTTFLILAA